MVDDPSSEVTADTVARDLELVRRIQGGDTDAYGKLVRHHTRRAYSIAYGILRHREDAEDVVQEAFARALDRIHRMDTTRAFHPWLYRIVVNTAISVQRARRVRRTSEVPPDTPSQLPAPDRTAELAALRQQLLAALDTLPDPQRAIVLLADVEEFSSGEIGDIMGMPAGTVRYQLHLARKALRATLAAADEEVR